MTLRRGVSFYLRRFFQALVGAFYGLEGQILRELCDAVFIFEGSEVVYCNALARKMMDNPTHSERLSAVCKSLSKNLPVECWIEIEGQTRCFLFQASPFQSLGFAGFWMASQDVLKKLVVAQDVTFLKEAREAKSYSIAVVSHEVKTPLTSLIMALRLLKKSDAKLSESVRKLLLDTCNEDVDRLRLFVDDLISVSCVETMHDRPEMRKMNFRKLFSEVFRKHELLAKSQGTEMRLKFQNPSDQKETAAIFVRMDPVQIAWSLSRLFETLRHLCGKSQSIEVKVQTEATQIEIQCEIKSDSQVEGEIQDFQCFSGSFFSESSKTNVSQSLKMIGDILELHGGAFTHNENKEIGNQIVFHLPLWKDEHLFQDLTDLQSVDSSSKKSKGVVSGTYSCSR